MTAEGLCGYMNSVPRPAFMYLLDTGIWHRNTKTHNFFSLQAGITIFIESFQGMYV
jgi:hypothetical protein